jgi:predicted Rossmann fold nucleotide-binding protein DprA/Smf involved in DNA uptake
MAARVLVLLGHDPATPDTLAARGGLSAACISAALSHLDMDGWVEQRGGRYQRTTGRRQT